MATVVTDREAWEPLAKVPCPCPVCDKTKKIGGIYLFPEPEQHDRYANNRYWIEAHTDGEDGPVVYMKVWRTDGKAIRSWADMQRIKNEIAGPEAEAVELLPAESRLMDTENCYWLWVAPEGGLANVGIPWPRAIYEEHQRSKNANLYDGPSTATPTPQRGNRPSARSRAPGQCPHSPRPLQADASTANRLHSLGGK
jgi:hypothetical protein